MISCAKPIVKYQKNVYKNFVISNEISNGVPGIDDTSTPGTTVKKTAAPHRCNSLLLSQYDE